MTRQHTTPDPTRRRFLRTTGALASALALGVTATGSAAADASNNPEFGGRIYADDRTFATKGVTDLPPPTNNENSFDELYVFQGATAADQLPVAEAAPGEQDYNGGRWSVTVVEWTTTPTLLTSDDAVHAAEMAGHLDVVAEGVRYFECPLVALKS